MTDTLTPSERSRRMSAIRARGNEATEARLARILRQHGLRGWRRNQPLPGKPDFAFREARLALFVDGCFWHGCRWHCRMPKSRQQFWEPKIARNKSRDREVGRLLRTRGWRVVRIWEHSLKDPGKVAARVEAALARGASLR